MQNRQLTDITQIKSFELKPIIILSPESIIDRYSTSTLSDTYSAMPLCVAVSFRTAMLSLRLARGLRCVARS